MRPLSRRAAVVTAASAALATVLNPVLATAANARPSVDPGWTPVSDPVGSTTTPAFLRGTVPSQSTTPLLRLFWPQRDPDGTWSIRGRQVLSGGGAGATTTVLSGWYDLNTHIAAVNGSCGPDGHWPQRILFTGNRTSDSSDPLTQGAVYGADSDGGESWTVDAANSYSYTRQAASTYGLGATEAPSCNRSLAAFTSGSSSHVSFHVGPEAGIPAPTQDGATADTGSGVTSLSVGDRAGPGGDEVWIVWASYGTNATDAGVHAQRVLPSPEPVLHAPGSARADGTVPTADGQPIGVATAGDGSLWVAYRDATNAKAVRLWQVGAPTSRVIRGSRDVQHVTLTSTDSGALWLAAVEAAGTRPNPSLRALRIRGTCTVTSTAPVPTRRGQSTNVWQIGAAQRGFGAAVVTGGFGDSLHLWLNASVGSDGRIWHGSVLPRLTLAAKTKPSPLNAGSKGTVTVTATDACQPVAGVKVSLFGSTVTTNAKGKATVALPSSRGKGTYRATATRSGYQGSSVPVRVR